MTCVVAKLGNQKMIEILPDPGNDLLNTLYSNRYISRIAHDDRCLGIIDHPAARYYGCYIDGIFVGAFLIIKQSSVEVDMHALLYRSAIYQSRVLGKMMLAKLFDNPNLNRVTAYIIQGLESAANYARKIGFKDEGVRHQACLVNQQLRDIYMLGIIREDWNKL